MTSMLIRCTRRAISQHKGHGRHGTRKGRAMMSAAELVKLPLIEEYHHGEGHGQLGTGGNAHAQTGLQWGCAKKVWSR